MCAGKICAPRRSAPGMLKFVLQSFVSGPQQVRFCPFFFLRWQSLPDRPCRRPLENECHSISKMKWPRQRRFVCCHPQTPVTRRCEKRRLRPHRINFRAHTKTHFAPTPRWIQPSPARELQPNHQIAPAIRHGDTKLQLGSRILARPRIIGRVCGTTRRWW
jgi:hypothetical protein